MGINRINRINEEVRKELSDVIRDLKDPRIPMMTSVVSVKVTNDLRYAKAYISVLGDEQTQKDAIEGLKKAAGFARREIGQRLNLRYTPELIFELDTSIAYGAHINELIHKTVKHEDHDENDG